MKLLVVLLAVIPAVAGEYAVLTNGFRVCADRHESAGRVVRLYTKEGGVTELDASLISGFEQEETAAEKPVQPVEAVPPPTPQQLVDQAARRYGLPPAFVHSVVAAESAYQPQAVSPKGAIGLMQLMPATAQAYNANPRDPAQNVDAGTAYLRDLLVKYGGDPSRALAAYNAGAGAVDKYNGIPPYAETQNYVQRVLARYKRSLDQVTVQQK
jgi:soluble lytic murein transglycosylase-like protein